MASWKKKKEETSFFDLIVDIGKSKKNVEFIAKKDADHLKKEFSIYLRTKDTPAKDVLLECISEAEEKLDSFLKNLDKASEKLE
jgi:DNA-directed RNA polymerase subunit L